MTPELTRHLVLAAEAHCAQQEAWAKADFFHGMSAADRGAMAVEGERPWRGVMSPTVLHLIHVLEEAGHYEAPPGALGRALFT